MLEEKINDKKRILQWVLLFLISVICSVIGERLYSNYGIIKDAFFNGLVIESFEKITNGMKTGLAFRRDIIFLVFFLFVGVHFLIRPKALYSFLFKKRYFVAIIVFLFLVINQYHGSSIAMFNSIIQPEYVSEYSEPIFGEARGIRSDEWVVTTPNRISASYGADAYGQYNYLMRATKTPNIAAGRMFFSYVSLSNPLTFGTFLFGVEYGQSILWNGTLILTFLVSIEVLLILCKQNKLISVIGAVLITFSSYNMWWSQVSWLLGAQACIAFGYHFVMAKKKWVKALCAGGLAIALAYFVTDLYPAWIVPVGYLFLGLTIWVVIYNFKKIKALNLSDWLIFIVAILFSISIIVAYLYYDQEYLASVTSTVYPGARVSTGGIEIVVLQKLFAWTISPISNLEKISNPSEFSAIINFFPLPMILAFWNLFKNKKIDLLTVFLLCYSIVLLTYCFIGWPEILAKLSLMSYSPSKRAIDVFSFVQLYLLLVVISRMKNSDRMLLRFALPTAFFVGIIQGCFSYKLFQNENIPMFYYYIVTVVVSLATFFIVLQEKKLNQKIFSINLVAVAICVFIIGIGVNPIQKGFDVIFEKPLSKEIKEITEKDPDGKWIDISGNIITPQFLLASGAPTINSTNITPNIDLWHRLDEQSVFESIYNRYAHVSVDLVDEKTSFELINLDHIKLNLSYDDLETADISYIFTNSNERDKTLDEKYQIIYEDQCLIYKIQ